MGRKLGRDLMDVIEQVLADPELTKAEAEFLESVPDLFRASRDEFEIGIAILERSLDRRGWAYPFQIRRPTYH